MSSLSIFLQNVRSIASKFDAISDLINDLHSEFTVLCFQEIWSIPHNLTLNGYQKFEYFSRDSQKHVKHPHIK